MSEFFIATWAEYTFICVIIIVLNLAFGYLAIQQAWSFFQPSPSSGTNGVVTAVSWQDFVIKNIGPFFLTVLFSLYLLYGYNSEWSPGWQGNTTKKLMGVCNSGIKNIFVACYGVEIETPNGTTLKKEIDLELFSKIQHTVCLKKPARSYKISYCQ